MQTLNASLPLPSLLQVEVPFIFYCRLTWLTHEAKTKASWKLTKKKIFFKEPQKLSKFQSISNLMQIIIRSLFFSQLISLLQQEQKKRKKRIVTWHAIIIDWYLKCKDDATERPWWNFFSSFRFPPIKILPRQRWIKRWTKKTY